MTILEKLEEELNTYEEREKMSEKSLELRPSDFNRTHYYMDMGVTNGLLLAIDLVRSHKEDK